MEQNTFNTLADAIIGALTRFINTFSGLLQISIYLIIGVLFFYALIKAWHAFCALARFHIPSRGQAIAALEGGIDSPMPLAQVAASFFYRAKKHYLLARGAEGGSSQVPPDAFLRDAAIQYSHRYFQEKFLEPIAMLANLMPPLGFIGTIIGMVMHFLNDSSTLNSNVTVAGIATALYTTFIGLVCYTTLELLLKVFHGLGRRRINEGLAAVSERISASREGKAAWE